MVHLTVASLEALRYSLDKFYLLKLDVRLVRVAQRNRPLTMSILGLCNPWPAGQK